MIHQFDSSHTQEFMISDIIHVAHLYTNKDAQCMDIDLSFTIAKDGILYFTPIIMGTGHCTITLTFILEENAQAFIKGAYALADSQRCNIITRQYHLGKNSTSNLTINGIAKDVSIIDYRGMIRIEQSAAGTHAHQENKTILFSPTARATSIPSIEVLNHEVSCAHGSAVGPLDADHILYARTRGLTEVEAKKMMVRSIFIQMLDKISQWDCKQKLVNKLTNRIIGECI